MGAPVGVPCGGPVGWRCQPRRVRAGLRRMCGPCEPARSARGERWLGRECPWPPCPRGRGLTVTGSRRSCWAASWTV